MPLKETVEPQPCPLSYLWFLAMRWLVFLHPEAVAQHWANQQEQSINHGLKSPTPQASTGPFSLQVDCLMYLLTWQKSDWHSGATSTEGPLAAPSWRRGSYDKRHYMVGGQAADCRAAALLFCNHLLLERLFYSLKSHPLLWEHWWPTPLQSHSPQSDS